jgi:hypothetical protein
MNRSFVVSAALVASAMLHAGCKGDDGPTVPLTVELVAPSSFTGLPSFPDSALNAVDEVVIRSYSGTTLLDTREVDVAEASLTLPDLPFGDDLWLSVEAFGSNPSCADTCATSNNGVCEDGGRAETAASLDAVASSCALGTDCVDCGTRSPQRRVLASGATPRFSLDEDSSPTQALVWMLEPERFIDAFRYVDLDTPLVPTPYEFPNQGRAGFGTAVLPESGDVLLVGGAVIDPTSPDAVDGTGIVAMRDTIQFYDASSGTFFLVYDADRLPSAEGEAAALRLPTGTAFGTATALDASHVLIAGGLEIVQAGSVRFVRASREAYLLTLTGEAEGFLEPVALPTNGGRAMHTTSVFDDGTVVIAGGVGGDYLQPFYHDTIEVGVFARGEISFESAATKLSFPRALHTATLIEENGHGVILAGGRGAQGLVGTSEVLFLDSTGVVLREALDAPGDTDLVTPRFAHTAALYRCPIGGAPFVAYAGGFTEAGLNLLDGSAPTASVEVYAASARFLEQMYRFEAETSASLSTGRAFASSVALPISGDLLVIGGVGADGGVVPGADRLFNQSWENCGVFEQGPRIEAGLTVPTAYNAATVLSNGAVMVTGGFDGTRSIDTSAYYNPGDFSLIADLY